MLIDLGPKTPTTATDLKSLGSASHERRTQDGRGRDTDHRGRPIRIRIKGGEVLDDGATYQMLRRNELMESDSKSQSPNVSDETEYTFADHSWYLYQKGVDIPIIDEERYTRHFCCFQSPIQNITTFSLENASLALSLWNSPEMTARPKSLGQSELISIYLVNGTTHEEPDIKRREDIEPDWNRIDQSPDQGREGPWVMCQRPPFTEHGSISKLRIVLRPAKWLAVVRGQVMVRVARWFIGFHGARALASRFGSPRATVVGRVRQRRSRSQRI